jgi:hypothetical protein
MDVLVHIIQLQGIGLPKTISNLHRLLSRVMQDRYGS